MENLIRNISIENFKSIKKATIEDCSEINIFIGEPNVGKSNILEVISLFYYSDSLKNNSVPLTDFIRFNSYDQLFFNGNIYSDILLKINNGELNMRAHFSDINQLALSFYDNEKIDLKEIYQRTDNLGGSFYTFLTLTFTHDKSYLANYIYNKGILDNQDILRKYNFKKYDYQPITLPDRYQIKSLAVPFGKNLFNIISQNSEMRAELTELFKKYDLKLALETNSHEIRILKDISDGTIFILPFSQIADTLKRLTFYLAAIKSNKKSILLFEEPEAHLFPPYMRHLTSEIMSNSSNQYFISTHSPFILNDFLENSGKAVSVYVVGYNRGETVIKKLSRDQQHEIYQNGIDVFANIESYIS